MAARPLAPGGALLATAVPALGVLVLGVPAFGGLAVPRREVGVLARVLVLPADAVALRAVGFPAAVLLALRAAVLPRRAAGLLRPFATFADLRVAVPRLRPPVFVRVVLAMTASRSKTPIIGAFPMPGKPDKRRSPWPIQTDHAGRGDQLQQPKVPGLMSKDRRHVRRHCPSKGRAKARCGL